MRYRYKHNPDRDLQQVVPGLSISLKEAVETGAIMNTGYIPEFNDIDSPDKVIGRVRDNFEAIDAMKLVQKLGKKAQTQTSLTPQTPSSATPPTNE